MSKQLVATHEVWKPVVGYEGLYQVSSLGRVKSLAREQVQPNPKNKNLTCRRDLPEKILKQDVNKKGYCRVTLHKEGEKQCFLVHRLILSVFTGSDSRLDVNHKNGITGDNRLANLEWVTRSENELHKRRVLKSQILEDNPQAKLTEKAVLEIREDYGYGQWTGMWAHYGRKFGVSPVAVRKAAIRETWSEL